MIKRKLLDANKVKVLGFSDPLPQYPWAMRTDLTLSLKAAIRKSFFSLKKGTKVGDSVLKPFKADGFGKITDPDYDIIRDIRKNVSDG